MAYNKNTIATVVGTINEQINEIWHQIFPEHIEKEYVKLMNLILEFREKIKRII